MGATSILPKVGLGLRQNLTGSDFDSSFDFIGTRYETTASSDDTTFLANAGVDVKNGNFTFGVQYNGEFGSDQQQHGGSLTFKYEF